MAPQQHKINASDYASTFPSSLFFPLSLCPSAKKIDGNRQQWDSNPRPPGLITIVALKSINSINSINKNKHNNYKKQKKILDMFAWVKVIVKKKKESNDLSHSMTKQQKWLHHFMPHSIEHKVYRECTSIFGDLSAK